MAGSGFLLSARIYYTDGTEKDLEIGPGAMIKFERKFNRGMSDVRDARVEHIMFVVYSQLVINKETVPVFADWVCTVRDARVRTADPMNAQDDEERSLGL